MGWGEEDREVKNLSPTKVEGYLKCPESFRLRYVSRVPEISSGFLISGRVVHAALEMALRRVVAGFGLPGEKDMDDCFLLEWSKAVKEEESKKDFLGWSWDGSPAQVKEECRALLPFARTDVLPKIRPKLVEEDAKLYYPSDIGDFLVWGKLDLLEEDGIVTDWKTTAKVSKNAKESWLQFAHYSRYAHETLGGPQRTHCRKIFLVRGRRPKVDSASYVISQEKRDWFARAAAHVWKGVKAGVFTPNTNGWHCSEKYCSFYAMCYGEVMA